MRVCVCVCIGWCDRACNGMQCSPHVLRFCAHSPTELRAKACYTGIAWNDFTGKDENFHLGATCEQGSFGRKIVASYFQHTVESTCVFLVVLVYLSFILAAKSSEIRICVPKYADIPITLVPVMYIVKGRKPPKLKHLRLGSRHRRPFATAASLSSTSQTLRRQPTNCS